MSLGMPSVVRNYSCILHKLTYTYNFPKNLVRPPHTMVKNHKVESKVTTKPARVNFMALQSFNFL
jgi:hypothetical protein